MPYRKLENVGVPRRSAVVRLDWAGRAGKARPDRRTLDRALPSPPDRYRLGGTSRGQGGRRAGLDGSLRRVSAPRSATQAVVELHLQWAPRGKALWSEISLKQVAEPGTRKVRLAVVHFRPHGVKTPAEACRLFEPLIGEAGRQHADLVVLGEAITLAGSSRSYADVAEPIPGPSTAYFGQLARQHHLYIVVGLVERAGHLIYNTAALVGPDGNLAGKYRKVCLPRQEIEAGVAPASDYPVFSTRFGKVAMMICYDGFFPEVARQLASRGAEVIAWPVWGCEQTLGRARHRKQRLHRELDVCGRSRGLYRLCGPRSGGPLPCLGRQVGHGGRCGSRS